MYGYYDSAKCIPGDDFGYCQRLLPNYGRHLQTLTTAPNVGTTLWEFSDGTSVLAPGTAPVTHTFETAGLFDVSMTVTTVEGCVFDTTFFQYV
jgi:hypothetical protein